MFCFVLQYNTGVQLALVLATLGAPVFGYVDHTALHWLWYGQFCSSLISFLHFILPKKWMKIRGIFLFNLKKWKFWDFFYKFCVFELSLSFFCTNYFSKKSQLFVHRYITAASTLASSASYMLQKDTVKYFIPRAKTKKQPPSLWSRGLLLLSARSVLLAALI